MNEMIASTFSRTVTEKYVEEIEAVIAINAINILKMFESIENQQHTLINAFSTGDGDGDGNKNLSIFIVWVWYEMKTECLQPNR